MEKDYKALKLEQIELLNSRKTNAKLNLRDKFKEMEWFFSFNDDLPNNWIDVNILDVTWLVTCGVAKKPNYIEEGVPFLSAQNARPFKANLNKIKYISQEQFETLTVGGKPEKNDILYTRVGNCGEAAKVPFEFDFAVYVSLTLIKPIHEIIDSDYLVAYLNSHFGLTQANKGAIGIGLKNLNVNNVRRYRIPLPPLSEQQRIVAKLDELFVHLDHLKTRLNHIPQILKNFRQAVLTQAVTGKLTEEWRVGKELDAKSLLISELIKRKEFWLEMEKEKIEKRRKIFNKKLVLKKYKEPLKPRRLNFDIPSEWVECTWDQLSNWITYGFTKPMPTVEEGIPKITVKHVKDNKIDFNSSDKTSLESFDNLNEKDKPKKGDILITKDGATLGRSAPVTTDEVFCIGQSVAVVWLRSTKCNQVFLNRIIQSNYIQDRIWEVARGMGMPHLSITDFRALSIGLPDLKEQTEIVKRVEHLFAKADAIEAQYQSLKTKIDSLPQAILAKAFKGELIEQLETDGNAIELLKEIEALKAEVKPKKRSKK